MQKYKNGWVLIRPILEKKLRESEESAAVISKNSGVSYWAVSRALRDGVKNYSHRAESLCDYFGVLVDNSAKPQNDVLLELHQVIASVWDGTDAHAKLLMNLIKTTGSYKIEQR
ncbi:hypothetical protein [Rheinheimera texasensis]|uniref:hypothetical protein n=1 Tax=Rheinheimera texasensis TaxID=306205 RepID=UPI0032B131C9